VIEPLNLFHVSCDEETLCVGRDITETELRYLVGNGATLVWSMHGEARILRTCALSDLLRAITFHADLVKLGRASEMTLYPSFHRGQTEPFPWSRHECLYKTRQMLHDQGPDTPDHGRPA
jgi:hypothetical protein